MDIQTMLFPLLGGLGLFLYGIEIMGDGLKRTAGDRLREILEQFTSTPFRAILSGAIITCLIQSSSATTVLAVGLVSSGFMTLTQAIGIILGANIGTTITSFIIGINLGEYSLPIIALGSFFLFFFSKPSVKHLGQIVLGFGMLFYGLDLMGQGMIPLQNYDEFHQFMASLARNPVLGAGVGLMLTLIMQSSSAAIGILQKLYMQGSVTLVAALPILLGENIGTTITAVLASIGGNVAARRTAAAHVLMKVIGAVFFLIILKPYTAVVIFLADKFSLNPAMQIAVAHGLFNICNLLLLLGFIPTIASFLMRVIPEEKSDKEIYDEVYIDSQILKRSGPTLALHQVRLELQQLSRMVKEQLDCCISFYYQRDEKYFKRVHALEKMVNKRDLMLTEFLSEVTGYELGFNDSEELTAMIDISKYLERIADHSVTITDNIAEAIEMEAEGRKNNEKDYSDHIWGDPKLDRIFELVQQNTSDLITVIQTASPELANELLERDREVTALQEELRNHYLDLISRGKSRPEDNLLFIDIVSNLERIANHHSKMALNHLNRLHHYEVEDEPLLN